MFLLPSLMHTRNTLYHICLLNKSLKWMRGAQCIHWFLLTSVGEYKENSSWLYKHGSSSKNGQVARWQRTHIPNSLCKLVSKFKTHTRLVKHSLSLYVCVCFMQLIQMSKQSQSFKQADSLHNLFFNIHNLSLKVYGVKNTFLHRHCCDQQTFSFLSINYRAT